MQTPPKVKLVIDIPNCCGECPLCKEELFNSIIHYGTPKSEFCVVDQKGVYFRVRNFLYENKIFFVVQANGKVADIIEITQ